MNTNIPQSPMYPFDRCGCDTYGYYGCYPPNPGAKPTPPSPQHWPAPGPHPALQMPCPPNPYKQPPTSGPMFENAFFTSNNLPYLYDNKLVSYGPYVTYSETVVTKLVRTNDVSALNISATFDMTDSMTTNMSLNNILTETITAQYESLRSILPVIKSGIIFQLYYNITSSDGGIVHQSSIKILAQDVRMHFTDIRDKFVFSCKNIMVADLQNVDYCGTYTITFEKIEAYLETINTIAHIQNTQSNPYYSFSNDGMSITVNHDTITRETTDGTILFASRDINTSFIFQANLTTRLRVSFTAFLPSFTVTPNTFAVWSALNDPKNAEIRDLSKTISELSDTIEGLRTEIATVKADNESLTSRLTEAETTITRLTTESTTVQTKTTTLETSFNQMSTKVDAIDARVTALETPAADTSEDTPPA